MGDRAHFRRQGHITEPEIRMKSFREARVQRSPEWPIPSGHFCDTPCFDVFFYFTQNVVELAARDVALHLIITLVIAPAVQPRRQLGAVFKREPFDGSL